MEFYFSGTIERIIFFEIPAVSFRILLLDINATPMQILMILRLLSRAPWRI